MTEEIANKVVNHSQETIDNIFEVMAELFSEYLNEWFCSYCNYHTRVITIFNKKLNSKQMKKCIVCGCGKKKSIKNSLKGNSIPDRIEKINKAEEEKDPELQKLYASSLPTIDGQGTPFGADFGDTAMFSPKLYQSGNHSFSRFEEINDRSRYTTNIGAYGFGIDHQHHHLGPFNDIWCLKTELENTGHISKENNDWSSKKEKAFQKYKNGVYKTGKYRAKQFDENYNICRHDYMSLHHILAICFYTDFTKLCTEYRSTYRRVDNDKNNDDVRKRHS
eukprot:73645_1